MYTLYTKFCLICQLCNLDTTVKAPLTSARRGPCSSLCYLQRQACHTQPFEDIDTVADIVSYSELTHGNIKTLGLRDKSLRRERLPKS